MCNLLLFSCNTNRILRLISIFVTARYLDLLFWVLWFNVLSVHVDFLFCVWEASAIFGNQSLMGRDLNLCFICQVFWYSVDIVNADVVMKRLHLKLRGSCSIGFCRFSMTHISSLTCCWCLLIEKCIFSQREDKIMHFVFYTAKQSSV